MSINEQVAKQPGIREYGIVTFLQNLLTLLRRNIREYGMFIALFVIMGIFTMESALLRAAKMSGKPSTAVALARLYAAGAMDTIELAARKVIAAAAEGDMLRTQMTILRRLKKRDPVDTVALGREVAAHLVRTGRYLL